MLWSGEEQGLLGSRAYVKAHPDLMPKISAVLVHDGGTNYLSGIGGTEAMMSDFEQVFAPVKELDPKFPFEVRKVAGLRRRRQRPRLVPRGERAGLLLGPGAARPSTSTPTTPSSTPTTRPSPSTRSTRRWSWRSGPTGSPTSTTCSRARSSAPPAADGPNRRTLGVQLDELTVSRGDRGGRRPEGRACKTGDVILKIDGTKVADREELSRALQAGEPKKKVVRPPRRQGSRAHSRLGSASQEMNEPNSESELFALTIEGARVDPEGRARRRRGWPRRPGRGGCARSRARPG